jgi:hypothetical protein
MNLRRLVGFAGIAVADEHYIRALIKALIYQTCLLQNECIMIKYGTDVL